jgi:hypothetical protein
LSARRNLWGGQKRQRVRAKRGPMTGSALCPRQRHRKLQVGTWARFALPTLRSLVSGSPAARVKRRDCGASREVDGVHNTLAEYTKRSTPGANPFALIPTLHVCHKSARR